jgi:hypothetical protein
MRKNDVENEREKRTGWVKWESVRMREYSRKTKLKCKRKTMCENEREREKHRQKNIRRKK